MHPNFADWYKPVSFDHNRETLDFRWKGVEAVRSEIEFDLAMELIRLTFDRPLESSGSVGIFRQYFKNIDPSFLTAENDNEVLTLAGCVLAMLCVDNNGAWGEVALAILTASACGIRNPKVEIDLVGMATARVQTEGANARKRPTMLTVKKPSAGKHFESAIAPFEETQDLPHAVEAMKAMGTKTVSLLNTLQGGLDTAISRMQKLLAVQDEELQLLWWVVGEWSHMWGCTFSKLDQQARPILLSEEAASLTTGSSEPPSLKAIFSRVKIDHESDFTIPATVNACGVEHLKSLACDSAPCSTIFPLHFAMMRALETGADESWIPVWSKASGIESGVTVNLLNLALQIHRERKLLIFLTSD